MYGLKMPEKMVPHVPSISQDWPKTIQNGPKMLSNAPRWDKILQTEVKMSPKQSKIVPR